MSQAKQNELLVKELKNDKVTKNEVTNILSKLNLESRLYDILDIANVWEFLTTKLSIQQKTIIYNNLVALNKNSDNISKIQSSDLPEQKLWIDSKNQSEISRTVKIDWKEYIKSVSDLFATDKDFKNYIQPSDKFIQKRKQVEEKLSREKWSKFEFVDSKYILW